MTSLSSSTLSWISSGFLASGKCSFKLELIWKEEADLLSKDLLPKSENTVSVLGLV